MTTDLAIVDRHERGIAPAYVPSLDKVQAMQAMAQFCAQSGFVKSNATTPAQRAADAFTIMMYGHELGIGPMTALNTIYVVNGKPALSGQNILSALYRSPHVDVDVPDPSTVKDSATVRMRRNKGEWKSFTFTMDMAQKAGLLKNATWGKYPEQMLIWRAVTMGARLIAPDVINNAYSVEELAPEAEVDENGEPINGVIVSSPPSTPEEKIEWVHPKLVEQLIGVARTNYGATDDQIRAATGVTDLADMSQWGAWATGRDAGLAIKAYMEGNQAPPPAEPDTPPATPDPAPAPAEDTPAGWATKEAIEKIRNWAHDKRSLNDGDLRRLTGIGDLYDASKWEAKYTGGKEACLSIDKALDEELSGKPAETDQKWSDVDTTMLTGEILKYVPNGIEAVTNATGVDDFSTYGTINNARESIVKALLDKHALLQTKHVHRANKQYTELVGFNGVLRLRLYGRDALRKAFADKPEFLAEMETWEDGKDYELPAEIRIDKYEVKEGYVLVKEIQRGDIPF